MPRGQGKVKRKRDKTWPSGHGRVKRCHHAPQEGKNCEKRRKTRTDRQEKKEKELKKEKRIPQI